MADEIKPPVTQGQSPQTPSSPSPISPQIKVPPMGQQASSPPGGPIPANLPTKEGTGPSPILPPTPPPKPPTEGPRPQPDIKLKPPSPSPLPGPKAEALGPVFKSSIRTMQEDMAAIRKGQPPAGFQMEKRSEKDIKPITETPGPKIILPPRPALEVKLGELERAKPLPGTKPPPAAPAYPVSPPPPVQPSPAMGPRLAVPAAGGINRKRFIFLIGGVVIIVFLVWFFALRGRPAPEVTLSPTPTFTPTTTPVSIENSFSIIDSVNVALGVNFTTRLDSSINKESLTSSREPGLYKVFESSSGKRYTFSEFLGGLLIPAPAGLTSAAYNTNLYLSVLYKSDNKNGYGFIVGLKEPVAALTALENWEAAMTQDLKDLFLFNPARAASVTFLDNTYQGIAIRYRNFPDPNLTIDYAVVTARDGENYLVITNSREHMYAIIDKMK